MPPTPNLPDLPLEIWLQIFSFACTDSGATSRALAQTSRYIRAVSAEYRYHAVVVRGWRQLLGFEGVFCGGKEVGGGGMDEDRDKEGEKDGDEGGDRCREDKGKGKGKGVERPYESTSPATATAALTEGNKDKKNLVHLYIHIPELYSDAYPPESWWEDEDSDVDSTYIPSEDEWEDVDGEEDEGEGEGEREGEGEGEVQADRDGDGEGEPAVHTSDASGTDAPPTALGQEPESTSNADPDAHRPQPPPASLLPFENDDSASTTTSCSSPSPSLIEELTLDTPSISPTDLLDFASDSAFLLSPPSPLIPAIHGQDLRFLHSTPLRLAQLEFRVLTSLRRLLTSSSPTLRTLTLCFSPSASLYPEAILPPLPQLRYLAVLKSTIPQEDVSPVRYKFSLQRKGPAPSGLLPRVEVLKVGSGAARKREVQSWEEDAWEGLVGEGVREVCAPCRILKSLPTLPRTVQRVFAWGPAKKDEPWGRLLPHEVLERFFPRQNAFIQHGVPLGGGLGLDNGIGSGDTNGDRSGNGNGNANENGNEKRPWEAAVYTRETGMSTHEEFLEDWVAMVEGR